MARELRYLEIAEAIKREVLTGAITPGSLVSSEAELARAHEASRITVRRALNHLKAEGLIDSRQGFGWYLTASPLTQSLRDLTSIERQIRTSGREFRRELRTFAFMETPKEFRELFDTSEVLQIARLDHIDAKPFAAAEVWIVADLVRDVTPDDVESRAMSEQLGVTLSGAVETISAVGASMQEAALLQVKPSTPLLRVDRTIRDTNGRAVLRSRARYNPLLTEFIVELPPPPAQ